MYKRALHLNLNEGKIYLVSAITKKERYISTIDELFNNPDDVMFKLENIVKVDTSEEIAIKEAMKKGKKPEKIEVEKKEEKRKEVKKVDLGDVIYAMSPSVTDVVSGKVPNIPCKYIVTIGRKKVEKIVYSCGDDLRMTFEKLEKSIASVFNIDEKLAHEILLSMITNLEIYLLNVEEVFKRFMK